MGFVLCEIKSANHTGFYPVHNRRIFFFIRIKSFRVGINKGKELIRVFKIICEVLLKIVCCRENIIKNIIGRVILKQFVCGKLRNIIKCVFNRCVKIIRVNFNFRLCLAVFKNIVFVFADVLQIFNNICLLYTSDAADEL